MPRTLRISIAGDHGGFTLKEHLRSFIANLGHEVTDHGTDSRDSVDYPDFAKLVACDVRDGRADLGVLVCTSGIGISMAANKIPGVRAAVVHNEDAACFSRLHNDANIICFGEKYDTPYMASRCVEVFFETAFEGGRHERRVNKVEALANLPAD